MRKSSEYLPIFLIIAGFLLIGLGWNGAAGVDHTQGQIPYLISGGLVGLAFVFYGTAALLIQQIKRGQADQMEELHKLTTATERVASLLSFTGNGTAANGSHNGELVVAGASTFHLVTCRLVASRPAVVKIPKEEAAERGLEPCRVCNP